MRSGHSVDREDVAEVCLMSEGEVDACCEVQGDGSDVERQSVGEVGLKLSEVDVGGETVDVENYILDVFESAFNSESESLIHLDEFGKE